MQVPRGRRIPTMHGRYRLHTTWRILCAAAPVERFSLSSAKCSRFRFAPRLNCNPLQSIGCLNEWMSLPLTVFQGQADLHGSFSQPPVLVLDA